MAVEAVVDDWDLAKSTMAVRAARVVLTHVKGRLSPEADTQVAARRIEILAATPLLAIAKPTLDNLDVHLVVEAAEIPDARALRVLIPDKSIFQIGVGIRLDPTVSVHFFGLRGWLADERERVDRVRGDRSRKAKVRDLSPSDDTSRRP